MNLGQRALHIAAAEAAGANVHPFGRSIHHHADTLHIGRPGRMGFAIGMADEVTVHCPLATDLAIASH